MYCSINNELPMPETVSNILTLYAVKIRIFLYTFANRIYINVEDHDIRRCVAAQLYSDYERVKPCPAVTVEGDRPLTHTEVGYDFYRMKLEGDIE